MSWSFTSNSTSLLPSSIASGFNSTIIKREDKKMIDLGDKLVEVSYNNLFVDYYNEDAE